MDVTDISQTPGGAQHSENSGEFTSRTKQIDIQEPQPLQKHEIVFNLEDLERKKQGQGNQDKG